MTLTQNPRHLLNRLRLENPRHALFRASEKAQQWVVDHGLQRLWSPKQWDNFFKNCEVFHPRSFEFLGRNGNTGEILDLIGESKVPFVAFWQASDLAKFPHPLALRLHEQGLTEELANVDCDPDYFNELSGILGENAAAECIIEALHRCDDAEKFFPELAIVVASRETATRPH